LGTAVSRGTSTLRYIFSMAAQKRKRKKPYPESLRGFGPNLRQLREAHKLKTTQFQPVSHAEISRIETEEREPRASTLLVISDRLGVPIDALVRRTVVDRVPIAMADLPPAMAEFIRGLISQAFEQYGQRQSALNRSDRPTVRKRG
jgi:transcriptional regulator with XRE-family HTH domain